VQPILDGPRADLNSAMVAGLLQGDPSITVDYGAEWFDDTLTLVDDISEYMTEGSTVTSDVTATIHRTCSLLFDSDVPFNYITDFVKPYMVLTNNDTGFAARFNLGVYTLQTPQSDNSTSPSVLTFTGYDLIYYLSQPIGDSYEVPIGVDPIGVAATLINVAVPGANVNAVLSGVLTTQVYTWPFDASNNFTYLDVVNALLAMVGYQNVWVDWDGNFQLIPYIDPQTTPVEWDFDLTDPNNIVAEQRSSIQDFFDVPNWWRFVMNNLTVPPVEGTSQITYIDTQATNPGSFTNRGRYIKRIYYVDAVDFPSLFTAAVVQITADLGPAETFDISTSPFPLAWHRDIIQLFDPNLGLVKPALSPLRRVIATKWTIDLDGTSDMTWTLDTVSAVQPV